MHRWPLGPIRPQQPMTGPGPAMSCSVVRMKAVVLGSRPRRTEESVQRPIGLRLVGLNRTARASRNDGERGRGRVAVTSYGQRQRRVGRGGNGGDRSLSVTRHFATENQAKSIVTKSLCADERTDGREGGDRRGRLVGQTLACDRVGSGQSYGSVSTYDSDDR